MIETLIDSLLQSLKIPHTTLFLTETLKTVPFKNSFYGISLLLAHYNVRTDSVRFKTKRELSNNDMPCIVLYNGAFAILRQVSESEVVMLSPKRRTISVSRKEFEDNWDGNAMIPRPTSQSREPDYEIHRKEELKKGIIRLGLGLTLTILICLLALWSPHASEWGWWSILATNLLGVAVSILLLQNQIHIHTPLSEKICGLVKAGDCDSVTHSSGAELFGVFKLSEIGFSFFFTNIIALTIYSQAIPILAIISYIVLPFSFWSIWYQRFKAKKWCVLCLCILLAMWIQAVLYCFSGIVQEYTVHIQSLCIVGLSYPLFYTLVNILMDILSSKKESEHWQSDFVNLKSQDKVITAYFQDRKCIDADAGSTLLFGNPEAPVEITVFSNPYCSPCAAMHERLKDIPGDIAKVRYVLTYFNEDLSQVNRSIIAAFQQLGAEVTWEILHKWYQSGKAKGKTFFEEYHLNTDTSDVWAEFQKQQNWSKNNVLPGTPTIIINGREIIGPYTVDDFKLISDVL